MLGWVGEVGVSACCILGEVRWVWPAIRLRLVGGGDMRRGGCVFGAVVAAVDQVGPFGFVAGST